MSTKAINVERLTTWEMTDETAETYASTANDFTRRLMNFRDTISSNNASLYGDGVLTDTAFALSSGTIELGIQGLTDKESKSFFGEKESKGTNITTTDDVPPYHAVALLTRNKNGTVNLRKWFRVQFAPAEENVTQKTDNVTFSTPTLSGTYTANNAGQFRAKRSEVDPTKDAELISKWFTDPTYIGDDV